MKKQTAIKTCSTNSPPKKKIKMSMESQKQVAMKRVQNPPPIFIEDSDDEDMRDYWRQFIEKNYDINQMTE